MASTDATGAIVVHKGGEPLTDFEKGVDGTLAEIAKENTSLFSGLTLAAIKEVDVDGVSQKACVLIAPFPLLAAWRKAFKVVQEKLEKNMNQHHVVLIAQRTQMDRAVWARSVQTSGVRPRSRSLKAVQEALLDDLVYPADIVGKRTRVKANGSHVLKVFLSQKEKTTLADKLDSLTAVYTKMTNKSVSFEFEA